MKFPLSLSLVSLLFLPGCDGGDGAPANDVNFRGEGGSTSYTVVRQTEMPVKKKGCDPEWWRVGEGELLDYKDAPEDWAIMIKIEAESMADDILKAVGAGGLCAEACSEEGGTWTGEAAVEESRHEVGVTEIVGECPFGTFATETAVLAAGTIACTCDS